MKGLALFLLACSLYAQTGGPPPVVRGTVPAGAACVGSTNTTPPTLTAGNCATVTHTTNLLVGDGIGNGADSGIPSSVLITTTNSNSFPIGRTTGSPITQGTNVTVSGTWPNITISAAGSGTVPTTPLVLKGDNAGAIATAVPSTDYQAAISQVIGVGSVNTSIAAAATACALTTTQCIADIPYSYSGSDHIIGFSMDFTIPDQSTYAANTILQSRRMGLSSFFQNNFSYSYSNQNSTLNQSFLSSYPVPVNAFNSFIQTKFTVTESGHFDSQNVSNFAGQNTTLYGSTPGQLIGGGTNIVSTSINDVLVSSNGVYCMGVLGYPSFAEGCSKGDFLMMQGVPFNGTTEFKATTNSSGLNAHTVNLLSITQGATSFGSHAWMIDSTVSPLTNTATSWTCPQTSPCSVALGTAVTASTAAGTVSTAVTFPTFTVSNATTSSPIVITTSAANGFATGQQVGIVGVKNTTGLSMANGLWTVTVIDATHFSLNGSSEAGTYSSGGVASPATLTVAVSPTLTTGAVGNFATNQLVCVADPNSEPEMIYPSAVSSTVTLTFHGPHGAGYYIGTGGLCGYLIENNADAKTQASFPELTGRYSGVNINGTIHPKTFMVISSTTSAALVAVQAKGIWRAMAFNSDYTSANTGVTMWKGAKVLMVSTTPGLNSALPNPSSGTAGGPILWADNSITLTNGDALTELIGAVSEMGPGQDHIVNYSGNETDAGGGANCGGEYDGIETSGDSECGYSNLTNLSHYQPFGGGYLPPYGPQMFGDHLINHWDHIGGQYYDIFEGCPADGCIHTAHPVLHIVDATATYLITGASNTTPIVITTSAANTITSGSWVSIYGVVGNLAANGSFIAIPSDSTHFAIYNMIGNTYPIAGTGSYSSGGTVVFNTCTDDLGIDEVNRNLYVTYGCGATRVNLTSSGSMVYPGAGIPVSTGSAWGTSYTPTTLQQSQPVGWVSGATYALNAVSFYGTALYKNTTGTNTSTNPSTDTTNWTAIGGSGGGLPTTPGVAGQYAPIATDTGSPTSTYVATKITPIPTCAANNTAALSGPCIAKTGLVVNGVHRRTVSGTGDTIAQADFSGSEVYTSSSAVSVALPQPGVGTNIEAGWATSITAFGSGAVTLTPPGGATINGSASLTITGKTCVLVSDGTNFTCY